jgi:trehalose/maltose transport system permease protein
MTSWSLAKSALFYLAVAAIVFFSVFPFYYAVITSFATGADLFRVQYLAPFSDLGELQHRPDGGELPTQPV